MEDLSIKNEEMPIGKYKKRRMKDLTIAEKIDIVHDALVKHDYYEIIALRYRINTCLVGCLVKKAKQNP